MGYGLFGEAELEAVLQPAPIVLREYQIKAKAAVLAARDRGLHRVMVVMATGCGKTTVFASLVDEFERSYGGNSLVVAHRMEILEQAASRIASMSPRLPIGVEGGDFTAPYESRVVVAGVQSIGRPDSKRLNWFHPGLLIMDEGHHAPADTWQNVLRRFGAYDGSCFTLAVTATDHRMDNKPLHGHSGAIFEDVVFRFGLRDAVREGWLVDLRGYRVATGTDLSKVKSSMGDYNQAQLARAVNTEARNHTALKHWQEIAKDRRTIVFCVDVQHAKDVAALFKEAGIRAEHVDGTMKTDLRRGIMERFRNGKTQVLVNVDVATEGFDVPYADCILMLRPTQSWALYAQMAGRGVRALPGTVETEAEAVERRRRIAESAKPDCIVIDVVDVSKEFGLAAPPEPDGEPPAKKPGPATVAGLVGLPEDFDLEGNSLFQAAERMDELEPSRKAALFRRQTSWEDLSSVLTEVDLIRELSIPEEVMGLSHLAWMKIGDLKYFLPCANSGMERDRAATLSCDELGRFSLNLQSSLVRGIPIPVGEDLQHAFDEADRMIRMTWPDAGAIVKADASWRDKAPTEGQKIMLGELGATDQEIGFLTTRGQARALIERKRMGLHRHPR
jgi:ATP-dependent helicase IRC3